MNGTPSAILTLGFGAWGGVGLLPTLGYGFAAVATEGRCICLSAAPQSYSLFARPVAFDLSARPVEVSLSAAPQEYALSAAPQEYNFRAEPDCEC